MFNLASYLVGLAGYIAVTPAAFYLDSIEYSQATALGVALMLAVLFQQFIHVTKGENQPTDFSGEPRVLGSTFHDDEQLEASRRWEQESDRVTNPMFSFYPDNIHHSSDDVRSPFDD